MRRGIPWIEFRKGAHKDDVVQRYRTRFNRASGVVLVGVAQGRASETQQGRCVDQTALRVGAPDNDVSGEVGRWTVARWPSLPLSGADGPADGPASLGFGHRPDHDAPIPVITMPIFLITIDRSW